MARFRYIWLILSFIFLSACSSTGIPRATPTVAPTATPRAGTQVAQEPTRTAVVILTYTHTPAQTATVAITETILSTVAPTVTASLSPSETPQPTATVTTTPTHTATTTLTPSATIDIASTQQSISATQTTVAEAIIATETAYFAQTATAQTQATHQVLNQRGTQTAVAEFIIATQNAYATQTAIAEERANNERINATSTAFVANVYATQTAVAHQQIEYANATATSSQLATNVALIPTMPSEFATLAPSQTVDAPLTLSPDMPEIIGEGEAQDLGQTGEATATYTFPTLPPLNLPNSGTPVTMPQVQVPPVTSSTISYTTRDFTIGQVVPLGQVSVGVATGYGDSIPRLYARNPVNPNQFVQTSHTGVLYVNTGSGDFIPNKPFSEYAGTENSPSENQYFVSAVAWSGNGRYVAFVVDGRRGGNTSTTGEDGVHVLDTYNGQVTTLVRDCPYDNHPGCALGGQREFLGNTSELHWSPDSTRLIVRQQVHNTPVGALYITPLNQPDYIQPMMLRYEYGTWTRDGQRVVVSGRTPDGNPIIGTINPDNTDLQVILDGNAHGLWIQHAVQRPNGSFVALGRPNHERAVRIIDQDGNFLTQPIGNAPPQSVTWSSDRSSVTLVVEGVQYIAYVNGNVQRVTVTGDDPPPQPLAEPPQPAPPNESAVPPPGEPSNEGTIYAIGQQLQIQSEVLNIRAEASLNGAILRDPLQQGEYVRLVSGPVSNDGFEWWQVMTADGHQGWIVGMIGVGYTFAPAD
jgi:hypothetical protein